MLAYILSFVLSLTIMSFAMKCKAKAFSLFCHILAILPPVLLLAFRGDECGTDTANYTRMFESIDTDGFASLFLATRVEMLFALLMYFISKMNFSLFSFFFICGVLTVAPVYYGSIKLKRILNPIFLMALFYLMFYQYAFNIVRQSIAMSLLFLAVVYLIENHKKRSLMLGVFSMMFHTVAVVYIVVFVIYIFSERITAKFIIKYGILLAIAFYLLQNVLSGHMESIEDYMDRGGDSMQLSYFVEMLLNFLIVLFVWRNNHTILRRFFILVSGVVLSVILISPIAPYIFRVANCIDILMLLYIPIVLKNINNKNLYSMYLSFALFFWWFVFIFNRSGGTYPYVLS